MYLFGLYQVVAFHRLDRNESSKSFFGADRTLFSFHRPNTYRSRRKSCQACADSKIKCDQQQPCSKCKARNRECIYRATTGTKSSSGRSARKRKGETSGSPDDDKGEGPSSAVIPSRTESTQSLSTPQVLVIGTQLLPSEQSTLSTGDSKSSSPPILPPLTEENLSVASSSYASSSAASHYSTEIEATHHTFAHDAFEVQNQLNALFSNEMFDKFFNSVMAPNTNSGTGIVHNTSNARDEFASGSYAQDHNFPWITPEEESQPFMAAMHTYEFDPYMALQMEASQGSIPINAEIPIGQPSLLPRPSSPQPAELQYYCKYPSSPLPISSGLMVFCM